MAGDGPASDELTAGQVAAIQAASDEARMLYAEITARDPSVKAAMEGQWLDERTACVHLVRDAYAAAGVSPVRAMQAAESWLVAQQGVRGDLALADEVLAERAQRDRAKRK